MDHRESEDDSHLRPVYRVHSRLWVDTGDQGENIADIATRDDDG